MTDRPSHSAEIHNIRDYQNHDELRERGLRAVASALGVEMVEDELVNTHEPLTDFPHGGDCA